MAASSNDVQGKADVSQNEIFLCERTIPVELNFNSTKAGGKPSRFDSLVLIVKQDGIPGGIDGALFAKLLDGDLTVEISDRRYSSSLKQKGLIRHLIQTRDVIGISDDLGTSIDLIKLFPYLGNQRLHRKHSVRVRFSLSKRDVFSGENKIQVLCLGKYTLKLDDMVPNAGIIPEIYFPPVLVTLNPPSLSYLINNFMKCDKFFMQGYDEANLPVELIPDWLDCLGSDRSLVEDILSYDNTGRFFSKPGGFKSTLQLKVRSHTPITKIELTYMSRWKAV